MARENLILQEQVVLGSDPSSPATNRSVIYPKSDGNWYIKNSDATVYKVTNQPTTVVGAIIAYNKFVVGAGGVTVGQIAFTVGGYTINQNLTFVFLNGAKLAVTTDYVETNGVTITLGIGLTTANDILEVISFAPTVAGSGSGASNEFVIAMATVL